MAPKVLKLIGWFKLEKVIKCLKIFFVSCYVYLQCCITWSSNLMEWTLLEKYVLPGSADPSSMGLLFWLIMVASVVWTLDAGLWEGLVTGELFLIANDLLSIVLFLWVVFLKVLQEIKTQVHTISFPYVSSSIVYVYVYYETIIFRPLYF